MRVPLLCSRPGALAMKSCSPCSNNTGPGILEEGPHFPGSVDLPSQVFKAAFLGNPPPSAAPFVSWPGPVCIRVVAMPAAPSKAPASHAACLCQRQ